MLGKLNTYKEVICLRLATLFMLLHPRFPFDLILDDEVLRSSIGSHFTVQTVDAADDTK